MEFESRFEFNKTIGDVWRDGREQHVLHAAHALRHRDGAGRHGGPGAARLFARGEEHLRHFARHDDALDGLEVRTDPRYTKFRKSVKTSK